MSNQESGVSPQVILGDALSGVGADPLRNALAKYNTHDHARVAPPNFYLAGVRVGDIITTESACGDPFVALDTAVEEVSPTELVLNKPALVTTPHCTIKFGNNKLVYGCVLTQNSDRVQFAEGFKQHGFVESAQLLDLACVQISGVLIHPAPITYPILLRSQWGGYVYKACAKATAGNAVLSLELRNEPETLIRRTDTFVANPALTSELIFSTQTSEGHTYLNKNESVGLTVESVAAESVISYSIYMIKDLAYGLRD